MKYLKDPHGEVYGFDTSDPSQVDLMNKIGADWDDVTPSWPPAPTDEQIWSAHQAQAQEALDASDLVALRCFKAGAIFPGVWLTYVQALRAIVAASSGDPTLPLPTRPSYPAGT